MLQRTKPTQEPRRRVRVHHRANMDNNSRHTVPLHLHHRDTHNRVDRSQFDRHRRTHKPTVGFSKQQSRRRISRASSRTQPLSTRYARPRLERFSIWFRHGRLSRRLARISSSLLCSILLFTLVCVLQDQSRLLPNTPQMIADPCNSKKTASASKISSSSFPRSHLLPPSSTLTALKSAS